MIYEVLKCPLLSLWYIWNEFRFSITPVGCVHDTCFICLHLYFIHEAAIFMKLPLKSILQRKVKTNKIIWCAFLADPFSYKILLFWVICILLGLSNFSSFHVWANGLLSFSIKLYFWSHSFSIILLFNAARTMRP